MKFMKIKRFNFNKIYIKYYDVIIEFGIRKIYFYNVYYVWVVKENEYFWIINKIFIKC